MQESHCLLSPDTVCILLRITMPDFMRSVRAFYKHGSIVIFDASGLECFCVACETSSCFSKRVKEMFLRDLKEKKSSSIGHKFQRFFFSGQFFFGNDISWIWPTQPRDLISVFQPIFWGNMLTSWNELSAKIGPCCKLLCEALFSFLWCRHLWGTIYGATKLLNWRVMNRLSQNYSCTKTNLRLFSKDCLKLLFEKIRIG